MVKRNGAAQSAMNLSLAVGMLMLVGKVTAWALTGSAAILSDAAESVIHVIAVGFAAFSLRIAQRPADQRFLYGYEKISFFSAGFEGAMIIVAAIGIIAAAINKWMHGLEINNLGLGTALIAAAAAVNLVLGWYLVRLGRREHNIILEANGRHVLTDSWTSFGVIVSCVLVLVTGWKPFDPIIAILLALNILFSGGKLVIRSVKGLLDYADPEVMRKVNGKLGELCAECGIEFHDVRFRHTGQRLVGMAHLLFPASMTIREAHRLATAIEARLEREFESPIELVTHLESLEDHEAAHADRERK